MKVGGLYPRREQKHRTKAMADTNTQKYSHNTDADTPGKERGEQSPSEAEQRQVSENETGSRCGESREELVNRAQNNCVKRQKGDIFKKAKALVSTKRLVCAK